MKRISLFVCLVFFVACALGAAEQVTGLWKIIDDKTQKPKSIIVLYLYQGKMYGRILATISLETGLIDDTLATKKKIAKGIAGNRPNCGLDFVYQMEDKGKEWFGLIMDPEPGDEYECVITKQGANLKVRGQLKGFGIFGREQKWVPLAPAELPADFLLPDPASFTPVIPIKK